VTCLRQTTAWQARRRDKRPKVTEEFLMFEV
jgi:hypothetical protein